MPSRTQYAAAIPVVKLQEDIAYAFVERKVQSLGDDAMVAVRLFARLFAGEVENPTSTKGDLFARAEDRTLAMLSSETLDVAVRGQYVRGVEVIANVLGRQIYGSSWRPRPPSKYYDEYKQGVRHKPRRSRL